MLSEVFWYPSISSIARVNFKISLILVVQPSETQYSMVLLAALGPRPA
jgi:hypothetical protein